MNARRYWLAAIVLLPTSLALAGESDAQRAAPPSAHREYPALLEELDADTRELLRAVTPEISLPPLELALPTAPRRY
jgi:hypothetical protein